MVAHFGVFSSPLSTFSLNAAMEVSRAVPSYDALMEGSANLALSAASALGGSTSMTATTRSRSPTRVSSRLDMFHGPVVFVSRKLRVDRASIKGGLSGQELTFGGTEHCLNLSAPASSHLLFGRTHESSTDKECVELAIAMYKISRSGLCDA